MVVYGYTAVNSDGWFQNPNFGKTRTKLFLSKEKCLKKAFEDYQKVYDSLAEEGLGPRTESVKNLGRLLAPSFIAGCKQQEQEFPFFLLWLFNQKMF